MMGSGGTCCRSLFNTSKIMLLLTNRYFESPQTHIAGIETRTDCRPSPTAERILRDLTAYIERYEPEFLRMLLGPYVADKIDKYESIHKLLVNPETGESAIAKYVYFHYTRDHATFNTVAGEKLKNTENSRNVSAAARLVRVWNEMVNDCGRILHEIEQMKRYEAMPLSLGTPFYSLHEVHPNFDAEIFRKINIYGI